MKTATQTERYEIFVTELDATETPMMRVATKAAARRAMRAFLREARGIIGASIDRLHLDGSRTCVEYVRR